MKLKPCPFCAAPAETHKMFPKGSHPWLVHVEHHADCPLGADLDRRCYKTQKQCATSWGMRDTVEIDRLRKSLEEIDAKAPGACTDESERMQVQHWRGAARDMARMARAALDPKETP